MRTLLVLVVAGALAVVGMAWVQQGGDPRVASTIVDPQEHAITFHLLDAQGAHYGNIGRLKTSIERNGKVLLFAMNGGMYKPDRDPVGLYVQEGVQRAPLVTTKEGSGNFSMQPNGVFGISNGGRAFVCITDSVPRYADRQYATQSGPMLVVDGRINAQFKKGSTDLNIRNGVGVMADGRVLFAISREPINFHDFANFFLQAGCRNALYLDGFVSKAYMPSQGIEQLDGDLGVLIAVIAFDGAARLR